MIGQVIGRSLLEALGTPNKKIVLLNDTVATLLAGKSASLEKTMIHLWVIFLVPAQTHVI